MGTHGKFPRNKTSLYDGEGQIFLALVGLYESITISSDSHCLLDYTDFYVLILLNSFPATCDFCHLLITFANSLDSYQAWCYVGSDLDRNLLTH